MTLLTQLVTFDLWREIDECIRLSLESRDLAVKLVNHLICVIKLGLGPYVKMGISHNKSFEWREMIIGNRFACVLFFCGIDDCTHLSGKFTILGLDNVIFIYFDCICMMVTFYLIQFITSAALLTVPLALFLGNQGTCERFIQRLLSVEIKRIGDGSV